jgi:hypothetical protein
LVIGYDQQFRVGRRSLLDLLTIQDNLFNYQISLTNASFQRRTAKARILAVLNRLSQAYGTGVTNGKVADPNPVDQGQPVTYKPIYSLTK